MSEAIKKTRAWLFGVMVVGALAFGATKAFAQPAFLTCNNPPYNGGTCTDLASCEANCTAIFGGDWVEARCQGGCCVCYL